MFEDVCVSLQSWCVWNKVPDRYLSISSLALFACDHITSHVEVDMIMIMWTFTWLWSRDLMCRPHFKVPYAYQRLWVVQTAGRATFVYISTCRTSSSVWYRHRVVSLSSYGTIGALWCRCLLMFVLFIKRCYLPIYAKPRLVVGMTKQMSDG